jgi:hypothetical protein
MKAIIAALTAASVIAGTSAPASARPSSEATQGYEVKTQYVTKKRYKKRYYRRSGGRVYYQQQYWADKLPVGTSSWWQQMDREQRGGRR